MAAVVTDFNFKTFGRDDSKWSVFAHQDVQIRSALKDCVLSLEMSNTHGANWQAALIFSPFPVEMGDVFEIEFSARATIPFSFSVWLGQQNDPYGSLVPEENHFGERMMGVEWQTFSHIWQPIFEERSARLVFVLGQIDNVVEIKDVVLAKTRCLRSLSFREIAGRNPTNETLFAKFSLRGPSGLLG